MRCIARTRGGWGRHLPPASDFWGRSRKSLYRHAVCSCGVTDELYDFQGVMVLRSRPALARQAPTPLQYAAEGQLMRAWCIANVCGIATRIITRGRPEVRPVYRAVGLTFAHAG